MSEPTLSGLGDDELIAIGLELARITHDVPYPRAANWAAFQSWRVTAELLRRAKQEPDPMPPITSLSDLGPMELRRLRDRVHVVSALEGADGEDGVAAQWWRAIYKQIVAAIDNRERNADELRAHIEARRAEGPVDHDHRGLPCWPEISNPPET